jgi:predicted MFS family arabinose efflux permease
MTAIDTASGRTSWKLAVLAALLAVTVGIGLSRFAYSALIPVIIEAGWVTSAEAGFLGAGNLAGYLAGALVGLADSARRHARAILRVSMLFAAVAFLASATPISFGWLLGWRVGAGVTGGVMMVLAAPMVAPLVPVHLRGTMSGVIFAGVGVGVLLSSSLVPLLATQGAALSWIVLGAICLVATGLAWFWWPAVTDVANSSGQALRTYLEAPIVVTCLTYGLAAVGLVPHMVFLVDFVARDLGQGVVMGGVFWSLFGFGALIGPLAAGRLADAVGAGSALRLAFLVQVPAVALPALSTDWPLLALSSGVIGAAVSGIVTLTSVRMRELVVLPQRRTFSWSMATVAFAVGQAAGGYAFSWLFAASGGNFALLFLWGAAAFAAALAVSLSPYWHRSMRTPPPVDGASP